MKKVLIVFFLLTVLLAAMLLPAAAEEAAETGLPAGTVAEGAAAGETAVPEDGTAAEGAAAEETAGEESAPGPFTNSVWALLPAVIAIILALITKEVYSSLFFGILSGALLYTNFNLENTMNRVFSGGFITSVTDSGFPGAAGHDRRHDERRGRQRCFRPLGAEAYPHPGRRPAGHDSAWRFDLYRRLFQLPDRRQRHAPGCRQA